jgi:hypothetical protein
VKLPRQLAIIALLAAIVPLIAAFFASFDHGLISGPLLLLAFPGMLAGLFLSGHGGNQILGWTVATLTNSLLYCTLWLFIRFLIQGLREETRPQPPTL